MDTILWVDVRKEEALKYSKLMEDFTETKISRGLVRGNIRFTYPLTFST